uniref:Uncharacterized protein n=1 Tax=Arion vulgaris TaxID=1028688 RepID=A0A0B6Z6R0_9EUPU
MLRLTMTGRQTCDQRGKRAWPGMTLKEMSKIVGKGEQVNFAKVGGKYWLWLVRHLGINFKPMQRPDTSTESDRSHRGHTRSWWRWSQRIH